MLAYMQRMMVSSSDSLPPPPDYFSMNACVTEACRYICTYSVFSLKCVKMYY